MTRQTRVLVVGGGSIGERHVRCFLATGRAAVSLCDSSAEIRDRLAARYRIEQTFATLDAALEAQADVAVVATPAPLHVPMARRLIERGANVLIEKPLSTSREGIAELVGEARRRGRVVGAAYVLRHEPGIVAVRRAVRSGQFGPPLELVYQGGQDFPSFRPAYREIYYRRRATGGGAIQDALTHIINAAEWIVGPMTDVAADADRLALEGVEVEDTVHVIARHGGLPASYALNQHQPPNESYLQINCRAGSVRLESHAKRWKQMRRGEDRWQVVPYVIADRDTLFITQAGAFLDAASRRSDVACPIDEAAQTLRACLAMLTAADEHRWVSVDDETA